MKTTLIASIFLTVFLIADHADSREVVKSPPDKAQILKLLELTKPGPEHEMMAKFSGQWTVTVKAGGKKVTGTAKSYMTMEKRFLWIGYDAREKGLGFKGAYVIGYDRRLKEFNLMAMDTSGTYWVTSKGKMMPESKTVKLYGEDNDPFMDKIGWKKEFAHTIDLSNPDDFKLQVIYIDTRTEERKEQVGMEFHFQRKK